LYETLVNNPVPQAAIPVVCDDTLSGYTDFACFQWLAPKIIRASIVFDFRRFITLPKEISKSFNTARLLQMEENIKVVTSDPVQLKDTIAVIPSTISEVSPNEVSVDGATTILTPSTDDYAKSLSQTTVSLNSSSGHYMKAFNIFIIALFALLI